MILEWKLFSKKEKIRKLNLLEMAEVYKLLKPFLLHSVTYDDLIKDIYRRDVFILNEVFEMLTFSKAEMVDGIKIISIIPDALRKNNFGAFVSLMQSEGGKDGSKN